MVTSRRAVARNVVMIVIAVVLLVGAVVLYVKLSGKPSAKGVSGITVLCSKCNKESVLTADEVDAQFTKRQATRDGDRGLVFKCPSCGEVAAKQKYSGSAEKPADAAKK